MFVGMLARRRPQTNSILTELNQRLADIIRIHDVVAFKDMLGLMPGDCHCNSARYPARVRS